VLLVEIVLRAAVIAADVLLAAVAVADRADDVARVAADVVLAVVVEAGDGSKILDVKNGCAKARPFLFHNHIRRR